MKEGLPFAFDLSLENSEDSYLCFRSALRYLLSHFFSLFQTLFACLGTTFEFVSSNIVEDLSINPSTYVFVLRDFNSHHNLS